MQLLIVVKSVSGHYVRQNLQLILSNPVTHTYTRYIHNYIDIQYTHLEKFACLYIECVHQ